MLEVINKMARKKKKSKKRKVSRIKSSSSLVGPPQDPSNLKITYGLENLNRR